MSVLLFLPYFEYECDHIPIKRILEHILRFLDRGISIQLELFVTYYWILKSGLKYGCIILQLENGYWKEKFWACLSMSIKFSVGAPNNLGGFVLSTWCKFLAIVYLYLSWAQVSDLSVRVKMYVGNFGNRVCSF